MLKCPQQMGWFSVALAGAGAGAFRKICYRKVVGICSCTAIHEEEEHH